MMSLYKELSRRNVFRVAIAYLVFSWLLLQIIELLSDILSLPAWVPKFILLLLAIGFIIAVIISWAYEITPEGVKKEKEVMRDDSITHITAKKLDKITIFFLIIGLTFVLVDRLYLNPTGTFSTNQQTSSSKIPENVQTENKQPLKVLDKSIAILPFTNRSKKEDDQFFTDGMHDDLLTIVSRISDLKVISRTSMMQYRDTIKSLPVIAKELGVSTILEGGIQRAGNRVRINVQLIDAETDQHLWAEIYDRTLTADNIFTIQSEITDAIATALKATLSPSEVASIHKPSTSSLQAFDLYLLGRQYFHKRTPASLTRAIDLFKQAIELDPEYALAYSGLSDSYSLIFQYGDFDINLARKLNLENARKAVELNPELTEAQASLGLALGTNQQPEQAELAYKKAIQLNPNYSMPYVWLGNKYVFDNKPKKALDVFLQAFEVDPLHPLIHENLVDMYLTMGQTEKAKEQLIKTLTTNPDFLLIYPQLVRLNYQQGNLLEAYKVSKRMVQMDPNSPVALANSIISDTVFGDSEGARDTFNKLISVAPNFIGKYFLEGIILKSQASPKEVKDYYQEQAMRSAGSGGQRFFKSELAQQQFLLQEYEAVIQTLQNVDNSLLSIEIQLENLTIKALSHKQLKQFEKFQNTLKIANEVLTSSKKDGFSSPILLEKEAILIALQGDVNGAFELLEQAYQQGLRNYYFENSWGVLEHAFSSHPEYLAYKETMQQDIATQKQALEKLRQECALKEKDCGLDALQIGI